MLGDDTTNSPECAEPDAMDKSEHQFESTTGRLETRQISKLHRMWAHAVIGVTVCVWAALEFGRSRNAPPTGLNYFVWTVFLLALVPLSTGALTLLFRNETLAQWIGNISNWMERRVERSRYATSSFNKYIARPCLQSFEAIDRHASGVKNDILRDDAKVSAYTFTLMLFGILLFWLTALLITIVLLAIIFRIVVFMFNASNGDFSNASISIHSERVVGAKVGKIYSGNNSFDQQVTGRIDSDGRIFEGSNFLNEKHTGRIDESGNRYQGTGFLNEEKVGRTDKDGNIYEGVGLFGERKVGRVDKDGNVYEGTNILNEKRIGRIKE